MSATMRVVRTYLYLEYDAYAPLAEKRVDTHRNEAEERWGVASPWPIVWDDWKWADERRDRRRRVASRRSL